MRQRTFKEFAFEAAHQTPPYSGLHGHSFRAEITLGGSPDPVFGWSHNLYDIDPIIDSLRRELDNRYLNEIEGLAVPTLENVARWIWERLAGRLDGLQCVTIRRGNPGSSEGVSYVGDNLRPGISALQEGLL